jgi:putative DNA primase/helicase
MKRVDGIATTAKFANGGPATAEPAISEDHLARAFVNSDPHWRWVNAHHRWRRFDGRAWREDSTLAAYDAIRRTIVERLGPQASASDLRSLCNAKTVAGVERLAKADRAFAAESDQWDADPWLLNTPTGTVNLRTGELSPHDPAQYLTKLTAVGPGGECPRFLEFLDQATARDQALVDFLQRMAGYSLTGSIVEHALFFVYGPGGNGKGVFLNTLSGVLADYAKAAPMDAFTQSHGERHPTEFAGLQGARLVTASETEEGRPWREAVIKRMTGGDPISARFMRGDFFEYMPQFKLVIAGNHKPQLRTVDPAMRRRLHIIPFTVTVPLESRDLELAEKLREEWPGILGWAIAGCLDYQARGLDPPPIVRDATADYFETQDLFAAWVTACCDTGPELWDPPSRLYSSWKRFAEQSGERPGRLAEFRDRLAGQGFRGGRDNARGRFVGGIAVRHDPSAEGPGWEP